MEAWHSVLALAAPPRTLFPTRNLVALTQALIDVELYQRLILLACLMLPAGESRGRG